MSQRLLTIATSALLIATLSVGTPSDSLANVSIVDETFGSATGLATASDWTVLGNGSAPCLTALTGGSHVDTEGRDLFGCIGGVDADGRGVLRLTENEGSIKGGILFNSALPTSSGIGVHFYMAMYGGNGYDGTGADGMSFFVKNGNNDSAEIGLGGGNLGYTELPAALLGIGFDAYGNFSNEIGAGCGVYPGYGPGFSPNSIVLRSGDTSVAQDGSAGYCYLDGQSSIVFTGENRDAAAKEVFITIDPATDPLPMINVYLGPVGDLPTIPTLSAPVPPEYLAATSFRFGFSAGTGWGTNLHELWGLRVGDPDAVEEFSPCGTLREGLCPRVFSAGSSMVTGVPGSDYASTRATYTWLRCRTSGTTLMSSRLPAGCRAIRSSLSTGARMLRAPYRIVLADRSSGYLRLGVTVSGKTYYSAAYSVRP
jgi:hypothetical protein